MQPIVVANTNLVARSLGTCAPFSDVESSACGQVPQTARPRDWPSPKLGHFFAVRRPLPLASPLTVHPSHLEPNCKTSALLEHACIGSATRTPSARARNWPSAADPQPLAS